MAKKDKYKKLPKAKRKNSKGSVVALVLSLMMLCLSVLLALCLTVFFKTKSITVSSEEGGAVIYTDEQIIAASGMETGKNMFIPLIGGAANRIETLLPYIQTAKIDLNVDGNVVIKVYANSASHCFEIDGEYLLVDSNEKALEIVSQRPVDKPLISGVLLSDTRLGREIGYADKNAEQIITKLFASAGNLMNITAVSTDADISFLDVTVDNKYLIHFLDEEEIDYKILHVKKSMESVAGNTGGIFTFTDSEIGKVVFKPCDINAPETEEETEIMPEIDDENEPETEITSSENED